MARYGDLDHPIWTSLTTGHTAMAWACGDALRYSPEVSPLAALREPTASAFSDLTSLVAPGESVGFFTAGPIDVLGGWEVVRSRPIEQMICEGLALPAGPAPPALGPLDVPEMLALAEATEPGPFLEKTIRMGRYCGLRAPSAGLVAMAGERLCTGSSREISAVCTDPGHRGRGHAKRLVAFLASRILEEGQTPFLHVKSENAAKALYESLGFRTRRVIQLTVIARR